MPVGAVFVLAGGKILAAAHNLTNVSKNATTHCEILCIREIKDPALLADCTVYVTVEPCIMCAEALNLARVKRVVYGCANDKFGGNGSILSLQTYQVQDGVLKDEAIKMLQQFYEHGNEKAPESKRQRNL